MPKAVLALLVVLAAVSAPFALPPEAPSGAMVLSRGDVDEALRKYRTAKDEEKRLELLDKLAPIRDPRVTIALGEALSDPSIRVRVRAAYGISDYHTGWCAGGLLEAQLVVEEAVKWWHEHQADLRRRARGLQK